METLIPMPATREACAADRCRAYGKNWTCPPHCGTLDACAQRRKLYSRGILLQTVSTTEKIIDTRAYAQNDQPGQLTDYETPYHDFNGITSKFGAHFILKSDKILMKNMQMPSSWA